MSKITVTISVYYFDTSQILVCTPEKLRYTIGVKPKTNMQKNTALRSLGAATRQWYAGVYGRATAVLLLCLAFLPFIATPAVTSLPILATHDACPDLGPAHVRCLSEISNAQLTPSGVTPYASVGYGPAEWHTAYNLPCKPDGPVASVCDTPSSYGPETIAIVIAGGYGGDLEADLQTYSSNYGIPPCTVANGCLTVVNQSGATSPLPATVSSGWTFETALDIQTAHAVCQTCKIVLVQANDSLVGNMVAAVNTAATFNPLVISNSWGTTVDIPFYDSAFKRTGMAVVAATGDDGTLSDGQSWPADIPEVIAAAGSTLQLNANKTRLNETVWSGSGGGCSNYSAPAWQTARGDWGANGCGGLRSFGDITAAGDPTTGAGIVVNGAWYQVGGTSLAAPLIAGMIALGSDVQSGSQPVNTLYSRTTTSNTHDITAGSDCTTTGQSHCTASAGFDVPSGLGAPKGVALFQSHLPEDINKDSFVNLLDFSLLASKYGQTGNTLARPDINHDASVNLLDFSLLAGKYGS